MKSLRVFAIVAMLMVVVAPGWAQRPIQVTVDGRPVPFDQPPIMQNGRVLVPDAVVTANLAMPDGLQTSANAPLTVGVFGFSHERLPVFGERGYHGFVRNFAPPPTLTFWPGELVRLSFSAAPGLNAFVSVNGQQFPAGQTAPGQFETSFPAPANAVGSVPIVIGATINGQPQQVLAPRPLVLMGNLTPPGQVIGPVSINHPVITPQQPLVVNAVGAPGSTAQVQVGKVTVPLHEVTPGHFQGTVVPPPGLNANGPARVTFRLRNGQQVQKETAPITVKSNAVAQNNPPRQNLPRVVRPAPLPRPSNDPAPPPVTPQPLPRQTAPSPVAVRPTPAAPPRPIPPARPELTNVVHNQSGAPLRPGQRAIIVASGSPHMTATLHVGPQTVPMREVRPGEYEAVFTAPNEKVRSEPVTVELRNPQGQTTTRRATTPLTFGK